EQDLVLQADQVIMACGQTLNCQDLCPDIPLDTINDKMIKIDRLTGQTSVPWVFAGGDASTGPSSVVEAVGSGERAAVGIDTMLTGQEHAFWREEKKFEINYDPDADPVPYPREKVTLIDVERRKNNFNEVEQPWNETVAVRQAKRCLRCDYGKQ
ncbi:MAG: FAD-dependent oxidoreductase, partial [Chitinispirillaceae bacterium]